MNKKKLFKKLIGVALAAVVAASSLIGGGTIASANMAESYNYSINDFEIIDEQGSLGTNAEIRKAFKSIGVVYEKEQRGDKEKLSLCIYVKDFKLNGKNAYISKIEGTKVRISDYKKESFKYHSEYKQDNGHPGNFIGDYNPKTEYSNVINIYVTLSDGTVKKYLMPVGQIDDVAAIARKDLGI